MDDAAWRALVVAFSAEAEDLCERVTLELLQMERVSSPGELAEVFPRIARSLHTLKGSAATLGLAEAAELAHVLEDDLARHVRAKRALPRDVTDAWLAALDAILADVRLRGKGGEGTLALGRATRALEALAEGLPATDADLDVETKHESEGTAAGVPQRGDVLRVASAQLAGLVEEVERVRALRMKIDGRRRTIERELQKPLASRRDADAWGMLAALALALKADGEEAADAVAALEDGIRAIATVPVRTLTDALPRAVRDLCRSAGKEAALSAVGADVSLDRRVLEALRAPLTQLVRNAVAHGIETPDVRMARGKHREGMIDVRFELAGSYVTVEVGDDGEGLDRARIRERGIELGLVAREDDVSAEALDALIFEPGFSTRDDVADEAGRGMGMSIVRTEIDSVGGRIDVRSVPGQGTRFVLTLPVELGGSPVLVVRCGEETFGVPLLDVEAGVAFRPDMSRGASGLLHREQLVAVEDLGAALGIREAVAPARGQPLLVLRARDEKRILVVDEVLGEEDVVIRPLPRELRGLPAYRGAATLALGELLLVLDANFLVRREQTRASAPTGRARVLVVDDSITARAMYRTILESRGYVVHAAASLAQAHEQLRHGAYAAILLDVQLEDGDGLSLAKALRARAETRSLPILVVSSRDGSDDVRRAMEAGADVFLRKNECAEGRLLREVDSLLEARRGA